MVYFKLGLALFQQDSCDDVAEHMVGGVPQLAGSIPNKGTVALSDRMIIRQEDLSSAALP